MAEPSNQGATSASTERTEAIRGLVKAIHRFDRLIAKHGDLPISGADEANENAQPEPTQASRERGEE